MLVVLYKTNVYNANGPGGTCTSLLIFDARQLEEGPVARAHLEASFPLGFHTAFAPVVE